MALSSLAQSREKRALRLIEKQRYNSAYVLARKALEKDPLNPGAMLVLSRYYITPENVEYQIDSAYSYIVLSDSIWQQLPSSERSYWRRLPLDSALIANERQVIEHLAFERAKSIDTEEAYTFFITNFPLATEQPVARELREDVAFINASSKDTWEAYEEYISRYPLSKHRREAEERYDRLLFEQATGDQTLEAYEAYLNAHPDSPFREEVERNIFEIATADGSVESFAAFASKYSNRFTDIAVSMLRNSLAEEVHPDSIAFNAFIQGLPDEPDFVFPVLINGKFGMMDPKGTVVVPAEADEIDDDYICGNITEDVLVLRDRLVSKKGKTLVRGSIEEIDDLGYGFLLISVDTGKVLLHKSGLIVNDFALSDAKVVGGRLLAIQKDSEWGLFTFGGRKLVDFQCEDVQAIGKVFALKTAAKFSLSTLSSLAAIANGNKGKFTEAFDDVRKNPDDQIWVRLGDKEGVLNADLRVVIPADQHRLTSAWFGSVAKSSIGYYTFNQFGERSDTFDSLAIVKPWVTAKTSAGWMIFDPVLRIPKSTTYDSIAVHGPFAVALKNGSMEIHLHNRANTIQILSHPDKVELLPSQDTIAYLALHKGKSTTIYNSRGEQLFTSSYDKISAVGAGFFAVSRKEKKGLIDHKGKLVLPVEYDAIGTATNGLMSVLKGMRFGVFRYSDSKLIKAEYDKNLVSWNRDYYAALRQGNWGFIDMNNKPASKFEFSEIRHWTDSVSLVKTGTSWKLFNLYSQSFEDEFTSFKLVREDAEERIIIVTREKQQGVLSNRKGYVIPITFTDIVNVGSPENPVYFTEKHVQEASLFVVIYYDSEGNFIRREVYEQDDYERIYCSR